MRAGYSRTNKKCGASAPHLLYLGLGLVHLLGYEVHMHVRYVGAYNAQPHKV